MSAQEEVVEISEELFSEDSFQNAFRKIKSLSKRDTLWSGARTANLLL